MLVYLTLRRDINCFLTIKEISRLESRVLKGNILRYGDPKEEYPLEISVNENKCVDGILVKRKYDKNSSRLIYISTESYKELKNKGLTKAIYFDGVWFGVVKVWDETKVKDFDQIEAMYFGQLKFDLGISNSKK